MLQKTATTGVVIFQRHFLNGVHLGTHVASNFQYQYNSFFRIPSNALQINDCCVKKTAIYNLWKQIYPDVCITPLLKVFHESAAMFINSHDAQCLHGSLVLELSTVAIGNPERHVRKASQRGSKQQ